MGKTLSPEWTIYALYVQILFTVVFFALAGAILAVLRKASGRSAAGTGGPRQGVASRLHLPVSLLLATLGTKLPALRNALPLGEKFYRYFDAAFVFFIIFFLIRLFDGLVRLRYEKKGRPFPLPNVLHGFALIVVYAAVALAILRAFLGFNIGPLLAGSAILTAVLGLALQGVLGNVFSGMSLHYTRSFGRGDWIRIGETEGQVVDTNWRETRLKDRDTNIVIIPNTFVASQTITNFSLPDRPSAIILPIKVDVLAPPAGVLGLLVEAAREAPDVLAEPAPTAYILSYDELGLAYALKFWIADYGRKPGITGEVARLVWHKLRRHGVEIPVPLESKVRGVLRALRPSEERAADTAAEHERNFEDLSRSSFLNIQEGEEAGRSVLSESEVRDIAARSGRLRFGAREVLFRQGETGDVCYVVARGKVRGEIVHEDGGKTYTTSFEVGRGGLIGEMSLFTGLPRTATVVVDEESELLEIRAETLASLLARNPSLAEALADVVSARNRANSETLLKIKDLAARDVKASSDKKTVLEYLKRLVHLFRR
jgi:small-conductance mechanosensitive channel/CRP-like cAMP-binding protein